MSKNKNKKKQSITMEDHVSLRYRNDEANEAFFDKIDYEVSSILLELSHPVVFSSHSPFLSKWGRTKKRSTTLVFQRLPVISPEPVVKSLPCTEVGEMGSTSSSSCLTGEAKKTNLQSIKKCSEEEFCTKNPKISSPILEEEMCLQPLICFDRTANVKDVEATSLRVYAMENLERRGFDLNLPASEDSGNKIFQKMATKVQATAQARQRRLALIRSKKLYTRFISHYQFN